MSQKALQDYTFISKYARYDEDKKRRENWIEAVKRVENMHREKYPMPEIQDDITWAFDLVRQKKVLGSQRALQFGGKPILKKNARLYNCTSSYCDRVRFFQEAFWLLLCGCGIGFSVQKHHIQKLPKFVDRLDETKKYLIEDSIEGWANALGVLMSSYLGKGDFSEYAGYDIEFNYSLIRPEGARLNSSSGKAPGPKPLQNAILKIKDLVEKCIAKGQNRLRPIDAYDIVMHASDAVLSGGVRRSATICLFSPNDKEMATAKTGNWLHENPQRGRSNNSALLVRDKTTREDFEELMQSVKEYGEPGIIWSDSEECLFNPCVEISLYAYDEYGNSGWEMCVSGNTKILTEDGIVKISDAVGKDINIWNGECWKKVKPFQTGSNRKLYRVHLNDGSYLDCTDNHKWLVKNRFQKKYHEVETKDLEKFSKYPIHTPMANMKWEGEKNKLYAYEMGFVLGDGCARRLDTKSKVCTPFGKLFGEDNNLGLKCRTRNSKPKEGLYKVEATNVVFDQLDAEFCYRLKYDNGLPEEIFKWNRKSCYEFIAGWIDSDGTKAGRGFRIYGSRDKLEDLQLLFTKLGFHSSLNLMDSKGSVTNFGIRNKDIWFIQVNDTKDLYSRRIKLKQTKRLKNGKGMYQIIKKIEKLDGFHDTFCVYESEKNQCVFNNVLTKQCNLCEINGRKVTTEDEFLEVGRAAAIIGTLQAGYTDFGYLGNVTKSIVEREALLGISITGMMDSPDILFDTKLQRKVAKEILKVNEKIANLIGINPCARATCIKPAGSTSCILSTASGIHPHHAKRYIRRAQANYLEPPLRYFKKINPIAVEKSVWSANGTDEIISFCVEVPKGAKVKNDLSATELLEHVKLTQQNWVEAGTRVDRCVQPWLRHNVSNTISVRDDNEWKEVSNYIYNNRKYFAGISLLPESGDKDYPQAPFVTINTPREIVAKYGDGVLMASGLIVDGLRVFKDNLWKACDVILGIVKLDEPVTEDVISQDEITLYEEQSDWARRVKQFADRYLGGDLRQATYLMKDVHLWKLWCDLNREYKEVNYESMKEEEDGTKLLQEVACAGGTCHLSYV